jgi:DNA polymerase IV
MTTRGKNRGVPSLCLDCACVGDGASRCAHCGSRHLALHPELLDLHMLHVDCDAFYAAVEKRDNPDLVAKPVIIGGGQRGVVATCCYQARIFGVHSAMPMYKALKKCPQAVIIKPNMAKYRAVSREIRDEMKMLSPLIEPISIDEAFIDMSGTGRLHRRSPAAMAAGLANVIRDKIGISVSIGLSYNNFLAKIASDINKPRGFTLIGKAEAMDFLAHQPVSIIWGVGEKFNHKLRRDGIHKITDLRKLDETILTTRYGAIGSRLWRLAHGLDVRRVIPDNATKSISSETTFDFDISDPETLEDHLWRQCEIVSYQLKHKNLVGRTVTLKLKPSIHKTLTRSSQLTDSTQLAHRIFDCAKVLLERVASGTRFRLLGVGVSGISDFAPESAVDLGDPTRQQKNQAERAVDSLNRRFGKSSVQKGRGL